MTQTLVAPAVEEVVAPAVEKIVEQPIKKFVVKRAKTLEDIRRVCQFRARVFWETGIYSEYRGTDIDDDDIASTTYLLYVEEPESEKISEYDSEQAANFAASLGGPRVVGTVRLIQARSSYPRLPIETFEFNRGDGMLVPYRTLLERKHLSVTEELLKNNLSADLSAKYEHLRMNLSAALNAQSQIAGLALAKDYRSGGQGDGADRKNNARQACRVLLPLFEECKRIGLEEGIQNGVICSRRDDHRADLNATPLYLSVGAEYVLQGTYFRHIEADKKLREQQRHLEGAKPADILYITKGNLIDKLLKYERIGRRLEDA